MFVKCVCEMSCPHEEANTIAKGDKRILSRQLAANTMYMHIQCLLKAANAFDIHCICTILCKLYIIIHTYIVHVHSPLSIALPHTYIDMIIHTYTHTYIHTHTPSGQLVLE